MKGSCHLVKKSEGLTARVQRDFFYVIYILFLGVLIYLYQCF